MLLVAVIADGYISLVDHVGHPLVPVNMNSAFTTIVVVILVCTMTGCQAIQYNTSAGRCA